MIELRWVERDSVFHFKDPHSGANRELRNPVTVLQYRVRDQYYCETTKETNDGQWSNWQDIPTVREP